LKTALLMKAEGCGTSAKGRDGHNGGKRVWLSILYIFLAPEANSDPGATLNPITFTKKLELEASVWEWVLHEDINDRLVMA